MFEDEDNDDVTMTKPSIPKYIRTGDYIYLYKILQANLFQGVVHY